MKKAWIQKAWIQKAWIQKAWKKQASKNKKGSALLMAVIIMMIVTMLSLALLLVSYSLVSTAVKQQNMEQCKELAQSVSRELEAEITNVEFDTYGEQEEALQNGKYPLWFYLRYNVWQTSWPYYNDEERGHTESYACRYFQLGGTGEADALKDISIKMFWENEEMEKDNEDDTTLVIQVTCQKGKQKSTISSRYQLSSVYFDEAEDNYAGYSDVDINPNSNEINTSKKWTWSFTDERE